ncbi:MAG TPA: GNAT family N-acetyltransferase [Anaerolineales bacterium]|nr:GNAT family N-acetyltransferase [Anaerolineales bacterium]
MIPRSWRGDPDLQKMTELILSLRANGQMVYPIAADLFEELADPDVQVTARLWEDEGGRLVGFAYVNRYQNLVDAFVVEKFTPAIETELIDWVVSAARRRNREIGQSLTLAASALESDLSRLAFLERSGFEYQVESSILMSRSLDQPIPDPQLPPGFIIRPMGGEAEIDAYVALHRAAFGTEIMTVEYRRTIISAPDYIPELDLVAVAPDGDLAAFCVCQIFPDDSPRAGGLKEGWTDPLGTHPAYQRLGLATALLLTGMRLLKARGMDTAILGTSSSNLAMQHTARSVGYQDASNTLWYSKSVD